MKRYEFTLRHHLANLSNRGVTSVVFTTLCLLGALAASAADDLRVGRISHSNGMHATIALNEIGRGHWAWEEYLTPNFPGSSIEFWGDPNHWKYDTITTQLRDAIVTEEVDLFLWFIATENPRELSAGAVLTGDDEVLLDHIMDVIIPGAQDRHEQLYGTRPIAYVMPHHGYLEGICSNMGRLGPEWSVSAALYVLDRVESLRPDRAGCSAAGTRE